MMKRRISAVILLLPTAAAVCDIRSATGAASDPNDPVVRIKDEGMNQSQVMQTLSYT